MDIVPATDPRVRVELTFHPKGKPPLTVSLPRWDYLDEATVRDIKGELRRFKQEAQKQADDIRSQFRRYQIASAKYNKAFAAWEKRLDDPEVDDPGEEPAEPARPEFAEPMDEREAERAITLRLLRHVLTAAEFRAVDKCTTAELVQAKSAWDAASAVPLGELLASPTSSTESTEGRSERTSSAEDGLSGTSGTGSPGETSETS